MTRHRRRLAIPGIKTGTNSTQSGRLRLLAGRARWAAVPASAAELAVRLLVSSSLAVDAYVHSDLAHTYAEVTDGIGEGNLFRVDAVAAAVTAAAALFIANRLAYGMAFILGVSAAVLAVVATHMQVGPFGPIPDLYDPIWYSEKLVSVIAESIAAAGAIGGLLILRRRSRTEAT